MYSEFYLFIFPISKPPISFIMTNFIFLRNEDINSHMIYNKHKPLGVVVVREVRIMTALCIFGAPGVKLC